MKKKALALGLTMAILIQPLTAPASFAEDAPTEPPTEIVPPVEPIVSYTHSISDEGLELIKSFEGFSAYPFWDHQQYSFGYGSYVDSTTVYEDEDSPTGYSTTLYPDGIPEREATELLREMVEDFNIQLNLMLESNQIALNQNQFDALSSFTYNLGKYVWTQNTKIRRMLISGEFATNQEEFIEAYCQWCHASGKFIQGLYERRLREMKLFFAAESMSDPNADLYVVNASSLYVRSEPTTASTILGSLTNSEVIRVHRYSEDGLWAYTSHVGYFGWVNMGYLIAIDEADMVTQIDADGKDAQGITYTFDDLTMTAAVGDPSSASNSSGYAGEFAGEVYLTKYLLHNGSIYTLSSISDSAFTGCDSIKEIYIPPCVQTIGENAFKDSSLKVILYTADSPAAEWAKHSGFTATDYRCRAGHDHGDWYVSQEATDTQTQIEKSSCTICGDTKSRNFDHIEIVTFPSKIEYKEAEALNTDGLAVEVVYTDGTRIPAPSFKLVGGDTTEPGKQTVTVQYSIFSAEFEIEVSEKVMTGISVSKKPRKLTYIEGFALDIDGLAVKANYDNGTSTTVTEYTVSGYDPNKVGKQAITVSYNGFTTTFEVTVKAKTLTSIVIASYPNKLEYFCGESFDSTGLSLKLSYDNGTEARTDSGFKISGYNKNNAGTQKVKVSYGGMSKTIQVVVILNYLKSDKYAPEDGFITVTEEQLTVSKLASAFESGDRVEVLRNGRILHADSTVGTGMTVQLHYNAEVQDEATLVVIGDLTGDGRCSLSDFVALSDYFVEYTELSAAALAAADVTRDGQVDLADYVELYNIANSELGAVALSSNPS